MHNGRPIFNRRIDIHDLKFELGICFSDTATFRQGIELYAMLSLYAEEIKNTNLGTIVQIKSKLDEGKPQFKRSYGCRPVIYLNRCHLESSTRGILLSVAGIDANNCMYPFVYATIAKERINHDYGLNWCLVMKVAHKGLSLKNILWKAATTRVIDFDRTMVELMDRDVAAYEWLVQRPLLQLKVANSSTSCSRLLFSTHPKSDILLNNMYDTCDEGSNGEVHGDLYPKIIKHLEELKKKSIEFNTHWNGHDQFEIESYYGSRFRLHLEDITYSCKR
ncbi:hypothetical protein Pfo_003546 [Paulownia fortunei]|nr:hypothetical protein Pfo_003546 [Paulownia fortunei]